MSDVYLTKSRFIAGQQCALRLWKQCFEPRPYQPPEPGSFAAIGLQIGEAAQQLFPGGVLVDVAAGDHASAVRRTRDLMSAGSASE